MVYLSEDNFKIEFIKDDIIRIRFSGDGKFRQSGLSKYGFINEDFKNVKVKIDNTKNEKIYTTKKLILKINKNTNKISIFDIKGECIFEEPINGGIELTDNTIKYHGKIKPNEAFFGLGDQTRKTLNHKGSTAVMWIENVKRYIPIPFFISSNGYGMFFNTTWKSAFDMGVKNKNTFTFYTSSPYPEIDYYFFLGPEPKRILELYTDITGKPAFLPKWAFGLWFICRTQANDHEVITDCVNFRREGIPCDVIGLEPGWMSKHYDSSTEKSWSPDRFPFPFYAMNGPFTFVSAIKRMGYKLELWEWSEYDWSVEEEKKLKENNVPKENNLSNVEKKKFLFEDVEKDEHFKDSIMMDKITKPNENWFEHHKKFIDQGVDFFKQDGCGQTCEYPDRKWFNGMSNEEMHNFFPLLYSRQMFEGFKNYTGKRSVCFTPCGWAGLQKYTTTWTGDTGGGPATLIGCLNLALSGHSLTTCDMEVATPEGMHYGFFSPIAQLNSWNYFKYPWLLGNELKETFKSYAKLRYKLLPYIYTLTYQSHITGIPMIRPMYLEFSEDKNTYNLLNQYMFGDSILISAFKNEVYLPKGKWFDYWTGKIYEGAKFIKYQPPEGKGGGIFLKEGAIIPTGPEINYVGEKTENILYLEVFPSKESYCTLYEDDGISFDYIKQNFCKTMFECKNKNGNIHFKIKTGQESYNGMSEIREYIVKFYNMNIPQKVILNGIKIEYSYDNTSNLLQINLGKHNIKTQKELVLNIT